MKGPETNDLLNNHCSTDPRTTAEAPASHGTHAPGFFTWKQYQEALVHFIVSGFEQNRCFAISAVRSVHIGLPFDMSYDQPAKASNPAIYKPMQMPQATPAPCYAYPKYSSPRLKCLFRARLMHRFFMSIYLSNSACLLGISVHKLSTNALDHFLHLVDLPA